MGQPDLLRDCEYEDNNVGTGRLYASLFSMLYLENNGKAPEQESEKSHVARDTRVTGVGSE